MVALHTWGLRPLAGDLMTPTTTHLTLRLLDGPDLGGVSRSTRVQPESPLLIGRGQNAGLQLPDASVSRAHAEIGFDGVDWTLTDLGSRHGCVARGQVIQPGGQTTLMHRDEVQIGAWAFRVLLGGAATGSVTVSERETPAERIRRVTPDEIGTLARRRLDIVLEAADTLTGAPTEGEIAQRTVEAVTDGVPRARVAMVTVNEDGSVGDVLASVRGAEDFELSRSLLIQAAQGETVVLESDSVAHGYGVSIMQLGIHSACCAPVRNGDRIEALLYLDARGDEADAGGDAAAFVTAMARIGGLALSNLRRAALEVNRLQIESDLRAARVAQRIMMPEASGTIGGVGFAMLNRPGRYVAGDLIGIEPRGDGRVCFYLGDVTGKGVGAAMLMGIAQSSLHASLAAGARIEQAAARLNAMLTPRIEAGQFISLWIGEYDPSTRELSCLDAGHGYSVLRDPSPALSTGIGFGTFPVGIDQDQAIGIERMAVEPGSTLLLFSDGLVEQSDASGIQFGMDRVGPHVLAEPDPGALVERLCNALTTHAGSDHFEDDLTIAAFRFPG